MKLYSTNHQSPLVPLKTAVLQGLPPDNGLYMPQDLPRLPDSFIESLNPDKPFQEIALTVATHLLGDELSAEDLERIVNEAFFFDAPLINIHDNIHTLELFHGPTLAFKDFAAQFMAKLMGQYVRESGIELTILVATSGDTGSAVANGFLKVPGIRIFILYPSGKVSPTQEQQLTTLGHNITALEVSGTFDDCQAMVKQAFLDNDLRAHYQLSSANSINIARLIPQSFYYFRAYAQLQDRSLPLVISVPSGNFGNLSAGLIAKKIGLSVSQFIAATNVNDVVPEYLQTSIFRPRPSLATYSNAMDVGNPSNFPRMLALYNEDIQQLKKDLNGFFYTDAETVAAMQTVYKDFNYILDPHGAVGYLGLQAFIAQQDSALNGIFLETAHPAKFGQVVEHALKQKVDLPPALAATLELPKNATLLENNYDALKSYLLDIV